MASTSVSPPTTEGLPASPSARRARRPRWVDARMLVGLLLVAAAVVTGAKVVSAADRTGKVWALKTDLAAGATLTESDLTTVDVRLDDHASAYLAASSDPVGKTLSRDVAAGDLLPAKAVSEVSDEVSLALSVPAARVPVSVGRGDRIALYATDEPSATGATTSPTVLVVESATVAEISERSQGALSIGGGDLQVVLKVPSCAVPGILDGTTAKLLTAVEVPGGAGRISC